MTDHCSRDFAKIFCKTSKESTGTEEIMSNYPHCALITAHILVWVLCKIWLWRLGYISSILIFSVKGLSKTFLRLVTNNVVLRYLHCTHTDAGLITGAQHNWLDCIYLAVLQYFDVSKGFNYNTDRPKQWKTHAVKDVYESPPKNPCN